MRLQLPCPEGNRPVPVAARPFVLPGASTCHERVVSLIYRRIEREREILHQEKFADVIHFRKGLEHPINDFGAYVVAFEQNRGVTPDGKSE